MILPTVKTQIIEPCAMSLELPPLVRFGVFLFFMTLRQAERLCFCCIFLTFSQVGNTRLQSTRFYYLSFYGRGREPCSPTHTVLGRVGA